jgi:hypothetical protein
MARESRIAPAHVACVTFGRGAPLILLKNPQDKRNTEDTDLPAGRQGKQRATEKRGIWDRTKTGKNLPLIQGGEDYALVAFAVALSYSHLKSSSVNLPSSVFSVFVLSIAF